MKQRSNEEIYRNVQVWGYLIVATQFAVLGAVTDALIMSVFGGLVALFALSVASAYNADGYSRRIWKRIGLKVPEVSQP